MRKEIDPVFGAFAPLKTSLPLQLPTFLEVGKAIAFERGKLGLMRDKGGSDNVWSNDAAFEKVVNDLIQIHETANLPTVPKKTLKERLNIYGRN